MTSNRYHKQFDLDATTPCGMAVVAPPPDLDIVAPAHLPLDAAPPPNSATDVTTPPSSYLDVAFCIGFVLFDALHWSPLWLHGVLRSPLRPHCQHHSTPPCSFVEYLTPPSARVVIATTLEGTLG